MHASDQRKYFLASCKYKHGFTFWNYESCDKFYQKMTYGMIFMRSCLLCRLEITVIRPCQYLEARNAHGNDKILEPLRCQTVYRDCGGVITRGGFFCLKVSMSPDDK